MNTEANRWQRIRQVFEATMDRPEADRVRFLREACANDSDLRREVESLLEADRAAPSHFMNQPAIDGIVGPGIEPVGDAARAIGGYEILGLIGKGGMGEVYRARDARLGRDVAIKILPSIFVTDPDRLARFEREARVLASLNHPNIGAIYAVEATPDGRALVLELVEGETLAAVIAKGSLPDLTEILSFARQIADALEAAHERGIIHRDLKPANIAITPAGIVKVLDFGLAKPAAGSAPDLTHSPTLSLEGAAEGMLLGTAAYMSPEQARGKTVDKRTDIWAFGCVLYEMLTGRIAFRRETVTDTLAALIEQEPDWTILPAATPVGIRRLLRRCLEKDPTRRLHDIADARIEIDDARRAAEPDIPAVHTAPRRRERVVLMSALALVTLIAAGLAMWALRPAPPLREMRVDIATPPTTEAGGFAISPDGQALVFGASSDGRQQLWLRSFESGTARPLPGTDLASAPFWSPDGRSVGFFADNKLKRIDIDGGSVQTLATAQASNSGAWNRDGTIFFKPDSLGPIFRVSAAGGEPIRVTPPEYHTSQPAFFPDGRHFLYSVQGADPATRGVYVARLDGSEVRRLIDADHAVVHAPSGQLLFVRQGTLFAQHLDPDRLELTGSPYAVAGHTNSEVVGLSASAAGPIAIRLGSPDVSRQFVWFDRSGKELQRVGDSSPTLGSPSMSPDGKRVAEHRYAGENMDIWLLELGRGVVSRFTLTDVRSDVNPVWSPDGGRIVFLSRGGEAADLYQKPTTGEGREEPLLVSPVDKSPTDWSLDGHFVLYENTNPKTPGNKFGELWALPMDGDRKPFPVVQSSYLAQNGQFSPDGKWIAYESNESGRVEIYVQPFPGPGRKTLVSTNGGVQVRWRRDGKELFYIALDERLMVAPIRLPSSGETVDIGTPVSLFATHIGSTALSGFPAQYVVDPQGRRFLINTILESITAPITVILNWKAAP